MMTRSATESFQESANNLAALDPPGPAVYPQAGCMRYYLAILLAGVWFATATVVRGETVDFVQAVVGDSVITYQQILQATRMQEDEILQQNPGRSESFYRDKIIPLREETFKSLTERAVVIQEYKRLQREKGVNIPEDYVDQQMEKEIKQPRFGGDRVQFDKWLQSEGMTREQYRNQVRDIIIQQAMTSQFVPEPIISPHKVETYYLAHQDRYMVPERVKFRWIIMDKVPDDTTDAKKKRMDEIHALIKGGQDFGELAKSYSEQRQRDDDWLESSKLSEVLRNELNRLKPGETGDVIELSQSYYLLHLDERDAGHVAPLNDKRDEIKALLRNEEQKKRYDAWIKQLETRVLVQQPEY